jgi:hypothetical protein
MARKKREQARGSEDAWSIERVPKTPAELHEWLKRALDVEVPRSPVVRGHAAPFDYLVQAYFEGTITGHGPDCVVWANRGGGKTFLGAVATLLDLMFKPGVQVRILGGSLEQSQRMFEHLRRLLERPGLGDLVDGRITERRIRLTNGSCAAVLAASQASVRGTRVQKVRCDEVDLFDPEMWEAVQLTTRSMKLKGPWGDDVKGSIEALSTMHRPHGLMWKLVGPPKAEGGAGDDGAKARRVLRWGVLDVLEVCGEEHACGACVLFEECRGRAKPEARKERAGGEGVDAGKGTVGVGGGHVAVADAVRMKRRVDATTWQSEMLCLRPRRSDAVYPEFDPREHVFGDGAAVGVVAGYVAGMDFGIRAEAVVLLASIDAAGVVRVEREHAARGKTLDEHVAAIRAWMDSGVAGKGIDWIGADPAGGALNEQTGVSSLAVLRKAGLRVRARRSGVAEGIAMVRARLSPASSRGLSGAARLTLAGVPALAEDDGPRLLIHERCTRLIECLSRYHYPTDRPESESPDKRDGFDHACDALRYLVVNLDRPGKAGVGEY